MQKSQAFPRAFLIEDPTNKVGILKKRRSGPLHQTFHTKKSGVKWVVAAQGRYVDDTPTPISLSSEPKAKEIDDEVSEISNSGVAAPTRHVKMRARQDNGLRTPPWTPGTLGVGRGEG